MGQVQEDCEEVGLYEYHDDDFVSAMQNDINYPFLEIAPITTAEEFTFFKERKVDDESALDLYCKVEGVLCPIGKLNLELNSLLAIRSVFNYQLFLWKDANTSVEIDLNSPESLMRFIKL